MSKGSCCTQVLKPALEKLCCPRTTKNLREIYFQTEAEIEISTLKLISRDDVE